MPGRLQRRLCARPRLGAGRTYTDAGISGLRLSGREGLKQLLADVLAGQAGFDAVLVYDVSGPSPGPHCTRS
jgi:DNA invertase Pin-like site-specific DNA recombinase